MTEKLKLILRACFVLGNKASTSTLFCALQALEASRDSIDTLVVVFCILIRGNLPPWHAAVFETETVSALGFTFPSGPSRPVRRYFLACRQESCSDGFGG